MKQPFRYFRAEFNGKYLYALVICSNYAVQDIVDELVYQALVQWKLGDEVSAYEMPVRDDDIINIAKIAGFFLIRAWGVSSYGSLYLTSSHIVDGQERSERGLFSMETERFQYVRGKHDEYPDDIVNKTSEMLRASFVPHGFTPVGYVPYGKSLYTESGEVIWENLLPEPPSDGTPYTEFYGERFLTHEEFFYKGEFLTVDIFKHLFECVQRIRRNGPTIAGFMDLARVLCAGYVYDIEIVPLDSYYLVYYRVNDAVEINNRDRRFFAWQAMCAQKFKLFELKIRI